VWQVSRWVPLPCAGVVGCGLEDGSFLAISAALLKRQ